jgi:hypothetical protein
MFSGRISLAVLGSLVVCATVMTSASREWTLAIQPLETPAPPGSAQPQLSSSERGLILSWIEQEGARAVLRFSEWRDQEWSKARSVASGTNWFVNWADVPSVVRLADGTLAAHWLQKSGDDTYAYDVRLSYSRDDGMTWAPSFTPHHDGTKTEHGFASLFQMPGSGLGVAWLDGRVTTNAVGHDAPAEGNESGAMTVRFAAFDRAWKQTTDVSVDDRVCDCCPTSVAVTAEGPVLAYRDRSVDETRDIYVSRLASGEWSAPKAVHHDGWRIAACPVNGPVLAGRNRDVAIAWFTAKGDEGHAYVAFSSDAGLSFGSPVRLDDTLAVGRVDVELLTDGSALASWMERGGSRARFRVRRIDRSGGRTPAVTIADIQGSRAAGYPRLAVHGGEVVFAWTESGTAQPRVQTARAVVY